MKHLLFVYGTLKQGYSRNSYLRDERYLGIASTEPIYGIFQYSGYPALVDQPLAENSGLSVGKKVWGELYEVSANCLMNLDQIEGVPQNLFERREIRLDDVTLSHLPTNDDVWRLVARKSAQGYYFKKNLAGAKDCGSLWTQK